MSFLLVGSHGFSISPSYESQLDAGHLLPLEGLSPLTGLESAGGCSRGNGQGKHPCTVITHPTPQSEQNVVKPMVCSLHQVSAWCTRSHTRTCFCTSSQGRCVYTLGLRLSGLGIPEEVLASGRSAGMSTWSAHQPPTVDRCCLGYFFLLLRSWVWSHHTGPHSPPRVVASGRRPVSPGCAGVRTNLNLPILDILHSSFFPLQFMSTNFLITFDWAS